MIVSKKIQLVANTALILIVVCLAMLSGSLISYALALAALGLFYLLQKHSSGDKVSNFRAEYAELFGLLGEKEAMYERDLLTDQFYHTDGFLRMLGYDKSDPKWHGGAREELNKLIHPDDRTPEVIDDYIEAAEEVGPDDRHLIDVLIQEIRLLDGTGKYRWVRTRSVVHFNDSGQAIKLVGTIVDINRYKQLQLEERSFLKAVVELCAVWDWKTSKLVQVSPQWGPVFGYKKNELYNLSIDELVHPEDIAYFLRLEQELKAQAESSTDYYQATIRFRVLNGQYQIFNCRFMQSHADEDRMLMVLFDHESIAMQTLASVSNTFPHAFYLFDVTEQKVLFHNNQFRRLFGYPREEFESQKDLVRQQVVHPEDLPKIIEQLETIVANNDDEVYSIRYRAKTRQGEWKTVLRHAVVYQRDRHNQPTQLSMTGTDITELVAQAVELESVNYRLAVSNTDLERFAYVASHDLQEPLRAIGGFLQLLEEKLQGQLDDTGKRYLNHAVTGADRMANLINDLLAFSRLQKKGTTFTEVNLSLVFKTACSDLSVLIEEHQAEVSSENLPAIDGNQALLIELFSNLLTNAIKYRHPERGPKIQITSREQDDYIVLSFEDNGIGIPAAHQKQVFELFSRLHRREEYPGTGIGLAFCERIVDLHNGRIELRSTLGMGCVFDVYLHRNLKQPVDSPDEATPDKETRVS